MKIGIPMNMTSTMCGVGVSYFDYFSEMFEDAEVVILSPKHTLVTDLDLLLLPGGADVAPSRYGKHPTVATSFSNPYMEFFDTNYLQKYIEAGIPVFGICRGLQTLNVHFGGTLSEVFHPTNPQDSPGKEMHSVYKVNDFEVNGLSISPKTFKVNSRHHQGVLLTDLAPDLIPIYTEKTSLKESSCIEAFYHQHLPIIAVQWHPEDLLDQFSMDAIEHLLSLVRVGEEDVQTEEEPIMMENNA